jgi:alkylation response protein AidB-like acyl-CoA dehydrogenase
MDLSFSDEQTMLRDSVDKYLTKHGSFDKQQAMVKSEQAFSPQIWSDFADMGLMAVPFSETLGGLDGTIVDSIAIAELLGKHMVIEPYISSTILGGGALALSAAGSPLSALVDPLIAGEKIAAFAHEEGRGTPAVAMVAMAAQPDGDGLILNGEKRFVLNGEEADIIAVSVRTGGTAGEEQGLSLVAVSPDQTGVEIISFDSLDGRRAAHIKFTNVTVPADHILGTIGTAHDAIERLTAHAIIAFCAEAVGAMGQLVAISSSYSETRKQFGVPISSFQVLKHRLADMNINYQKSRASLLYTAALLEAGICSRKDISVLKGQIGRLGRSLGEAAVQTHGGVGTTDELNVGHYLKRILTVDALFGNSDYHLRSVGAA